MKKKFDWKEYAALARLLGAEGCVLLKNEKNTLPLKEGTRVAVYGRTQFDYIKSGTGSGGLVNTPYVVNIYDGLKEEADLKIDESVADTYRAWLKDHPFDRGVGWAGEPFSQVEMELDSQRVSEEANRNDLAIAVLGRLAGEDKDNTPDKGSYDLRDDERQMLTTLVKHYNKVCVLINSGNIIDMKWVEEIKPSAVMYVWQGGAEGGHSIADVLTGRINPCGRLTDTIARDIEDYPSTSNFGDPNIGVYAEDIYVGYRYFETFARDKVLYPFGFGLSYTDFAHRGILSFDGERINVTVKITNTGALAGREVSQIYYRAPEGKLSKPERELIRFCKSETLFPGIEGEYSVSFAASEMASFDDSGVTGYLDSWVLEPGEYRIYEGKNVRDAVEIGSISIGDTVLIEKLSEALAPIHPFKRMTRDAAGNISWEDTPLRNKGFMERMKEDRSNLTEIPYAGAQKHTLQEVKEGKASLDDFIAGLSDEEMLAMTRGEGMCSPRVCPGTAAAFAGVTDDLVKYGVPSMCCADGPSGIRMDAGIKAMQLPNGVCLACSFDTEKVKELYEYLGRELRFHEIDSLLGPGMNIHRNPLNGRNFEYFSEDPYMTGAMAVAELKGMHENHVTGMIKHFSCNNQEHGRHSIDSVVSKRALREIYLKGFEMAVKGAGAYLVMSTYGSLNGIHTAASYDQNETVLRKEWGFKGIVATDWWTMINDEGGEADRKKTSFMIRGANDIYMCTTGALENGNGDDSPEGLKNGVFTRAELQRNVRRILKVAMDSLAFDRLAGIKDEWEILNAPKDETEEKVHEAYVTVNGETVIDPSVIDTSKGTTNKIRLHLEKIVPYALVMEVAADGPELSQIPLLLSLSGISKKMVSLKGSDREFREVRMSLENFMNIDIYLGMHFGQDGMILRNIRIVEE